MLKSRIISTEYEVLCLEYQITGYHSCLHSQKPVRCFNVQLLRERELTLPNLKASCTSWGKFRPVKTQTPTNSCDNFTVWNTGAAKSWNPFCFTIAVNCSDITQLDKMSSNAQTDISLSISFVPPIFVADIAGWKTGVGHSMSTYRTMMTRLSPLLLNINWTPRETLKPGGVQIFFFNRCLWRDTLFFTEKVTSRQRSKHLLHLLGVIYLEGN